MLDESAEFVSEILVVSRRWRGLTYNSVKAVGYKAVVV